MKKRPIAQVSKDIDTFLKIIFQYLGTEYNGKTVKKDNEYFFFLLLNKLSDNLIAANKLFAGIKEYPHSYGGLGLILRTCMSDVIYFHYFSSLINAGNDDNNQSLIEESVKALWSDHVKFVIQFDKLKEEVGYLKEPNKSQEISLLNECFKDYLETNVKSNWEYKLKDRKRFTFSSIFEEWKPVKPLVFKAVEIYNLFSKIEHNGELTYIVHNRAIESFDSALDDLYSSLEIITTTISVIARALFRNIDGSEDKIQAYDVKYYEN